MRPSKDYYKKPKPQQKGCSTLCCGNCRLSVSSSEEESVSSSERFPSISSLAHAMVQERLDQMIREASEEARHRERVIRRHCHVLDRGMSQNACAGWTSGSKKRDHGTKFVVMFAMEKCSYDPREDFRESMVEMIMVNRIQEAKELRSLLNYYLSMNSEEYHWIILEVFHEVCSDLFLSCKWR